MVSWEMIRTNCAWKNNKDIFSIVDRWSRFHQNSEIYLPDNADAFVHCVIVSPAYLIICPMTKTRTVSVLGVVLQILTAIHICEYRFSTDIGHSWQAFWNQKPENDLKCCIYIYCSTINYRPYVLLPEKGQIYLFNIIAILYVHRSDCKLHPPSMSLILHCSCVVRAIKLLTYQ